MNLVILEILQSDWAALLSAAEQILHKLDQSSEAWRPAGPRPARSSSRSLLCAKVGNDLLWSLLKNVQSPKN